MCRPPTYPSYVANIHTSTCRSSTSKKLLPLLDNSLHTVSTPCQQDRAVCSFIGHVLGSPRLLDTDPQVKMEGKWYVDLMTIGAEVATRAPVTVGPALVHVVQNDRSDRFHGNGEWGWGVAAVAHCNPQQQRPGGGGGGGGGGVGGGGGGGGGLETALKETKFSNRIVPSRHDVLPDHYTCSLATQTCSALGLLNSGNLITQVGV